jgi:hypothetical protein
MAESVTMKTDVLTAIGHVLDEYRHPIEVISVGLALITANFKEWFDARGRKALFNGILIASIAAAVLFPLSEYWSDKDDRLLHQAMDHLARGEEAVDHGDRISDPKVIEVGLSEIKEAQSEFLKIGGEEIKPRQLKADRYGAYYSRDKAFIGSRTVTSYWSSGTNLTTCTADQPAALDKKTPRLVCFDPPSQADDAQADYQEAHLLFHHLATDLLKINLPEQADLSNTERDWLQLEMVELVEGSKQAGDFFLCAFLRAKSPVKSDLDEAEGMFKLYQRVSSHMKWSSDLKDAETKLELLQASTAPIGQLTKCPPPVHGEWKTDWLTANDAPLTGPFVFSYVGPGKVFYRSKDKRWPLIPGVQVYVAPGMDIVVERETQKGSEQIPVLYSGYVP